MEPLAVQRLPTVELESEAPDELRHTPLGGIGLLACGVVHEFAEVAEVDIPTTNARYRVTVKGTQLARPPLGRAS